MGSPERKPTNPLIKRARAAMGSRPGAGGGTTPAESGAEAERSAESEAEVAASPRPSALRQSVTEAGQRIQQIVDAAERVAADIEADARTEADRYLGDRVREADRLFEARAEALKEMTAGILEQAEVLRGEAAALTSRVAQFLDEAGGGGERHAPDAAKVAPEEGPAPRDERAVAPSRASDGEDSDTAVSEDALLRATQMAVAGSSRDEIETVLRTEFSVSDPTSVADEILGPR